MAVDLETKFEQLDEIRFLLADVINYLETIEYKIGEDDRVWKLVNEAWDITTDEWLSVDRELESQKA